MLKFNIVSPGFDSYDKYVGIQGPSELRLLVYYDDCPHDQVKILAERAVDILNSNWTDVHAYFCTNEDCENWSCAIGTNGLEHSICKECNQPTEYRIIT